MADAIKSIGEKKKGQKIMSKKFIVALLTTGVLLAGGSFATYKAFETHNVAYDLNGGKLTSEEKVESVRWIDDVETPVAEKDHYVFKGWADGNETMTSIKHARNEVSLTAVYSPEVYTLTFKDGNKEISKSNYAYGSETKLSDVFVKATLADHPYEEFDTWQIEGKNVSALSKNDFGDKTVSAKFKGKTYKISYETYDGTVEGAPSEYTYGEGVSKFPDASKDGKIFDGWFSDEDCTNQVTSIPADSHGDITLYAEYHNAPVVQKTYSSGSGRRYTSSGSGTASYSAPATMDYSIGVSIPEIGYHVDNAVLNGGQAAVDAANSGLYFYQSYYWYRNKTTGEVIGYQPDLDSQIWECCDQKDYIVYGDHASQGLSRLPQRLSAGSVAYFNGVAHTYSGYYSIGDWVETHSEYSLVIETCTPNNDGTHYYCYFY